MNGQTICTCLRLLTNDSSSEESSTSDNDWDSVNMQRSSLNELPPQSGNESPQMVQLAAQFEQFSFKDSDEQPPAESEPQAQSPPPPSLAQIEPIAGDIGEQVAMEENPNAKPELVIPPKQVNTVVPLEDVNQKPVLPLEDVNQKPVLPPEDAKLRTVLPPEDVKQSPALPPEDVNQSPALPPEHQVNKSPENVPRENLDGKPQPQPPPAEEEKDGNYFLQILREEQKRLLDLAATADNYVASFGTKINRHEYALEKLRHFSGLARLLVSSKMGQFEELCLTNIKNSSNCPFPVTNNDLHGFWDMIYQQVPPLDADFAEILKLKDNNWLAPPPPPPRSVPGTSKNSAAFAGSKPAPKRKAKCAKTQERVWRI